jgi:hypothetical protein
MTDFGALYSGRPSRLRALSQRKSRPAASVKVCGCRLMKVQPRTPGPAYANLQWRKPREVWRGGASDAIGILSCLSASTTFAIWHELCERVKTPFVVPVISRVTRCKKGTYYNFCVMCLMAAFVPHRPNKYFHVTASNGIVSSSPYTPLAIMTASPIALVRVSETVRDADVVALRSVRSQRRR